MYQINSSKLFLTYPQCSLTKERVLELLSERFQPICYIVAHELHANGDSHIHAYLELEHAYRTRDPRFADLDGFHGNYQGCRSSKSVQKYCTKAEDYLSNIDLANLGKSSRSQDFGRLIRDEISLVQLIDEKPQYLFDLQKLQTNYNLYKKLKVDVKPDLPSFVPNPWGKVILSNKNAKKRHYWIYSTAPNYGKTYHFAKPLAKNYNVHLRSGESPYWNIHGTETCIIYDEFNFAIEKYYVLNSMCDGTYTYRAFQRGNILLRDPLIIVLSNHSICDLYPYMNNLLYERFNEIKLI